MQSQFLIVATKEKSTIVRANKALYKLRNSFAYLKQHRPAYYKKRLKYLVAKAKERYRTNFKDFLGRRHHYYTFRIKAVNIELYKFINLPNKTKEIEIEIERLLDKRAKIEAKDILVKKQIEEECLKESLK